MPRVLIVEDEMLVAMLIEDLVADIGYEVAATAMRLEAALAVATTQDFDLAIVDINLAGEQSFPVADRLVERGIPFIFASGYGAAGLSEAYRDRPVLQKPFDARALSQALANLNV